MRLRYRRAEVRHALWKPAARQWFPGGARASEGVRVTAYECGNVQVRLVRGNPNDWHTSWGIFFRVGTGNRWRRVYAPSRPWGHGSAHQAKIGAGRIGKKYLTEARHGTRSRC